MDTLKTYHHLIYAIVVVADLIVMAFGLHQFEYFVKPAILITIIGIFIQMADRNSTLFKWGLLAFIFSLVGDVVLLFAKFNELFFLAGIAGFLLSHLFFIVTFRQHEQKTPSYLRTKPAWIILVATLGISLYIVLFPYLDILLKVAVFIYASAISTMLLTAVNRKEQVPPASYIWCVLGAILFFISDALLAINKFWIVVPLSSIWIMSTYMLAQYFILVGLVNQQAQTGVKNQPEKRK